MARETGSGSAGEYVRELYLVAFEERALYKETYAGHAGTVVLESQHLRPKDARSSTVVISMHPIGGTQYLPLPAALARAGVPVICRNSRYPRNDSALIMEKVALDLGACVRHAREKLGYEKVVLLGWSGGGALSAFYQAQAEPRRLDANIDPNERKSPGRHMGDPRTVNDGPAGLARFCTLRSWLSQWSYTLSNTDGPRALAHVSVPVFMLDCGADDGCTPHHIERFWNAIGHAGKERCIIPGATHYFFGQKDKCDAAAAAITGWLAKKGFGA